MTWFVLPSSVFRSAALVAPAVSFRTVSVSASFASAFARSLTRLDADAEVTVAVTTPVVAFAIAFVSTAEIEGPDTFTSTSPSFATIALNAAVRTPPDT